MMNTEKLENLGIAELRQLVRFIDPNTRGAGNLGNVGKRAEILDHLRDIDLSDDDFARWENSRAAAPAPAAVEVPAANPAPAAPATGDVADKLAALQALQTLFGGNAPAQIDEKQVEVIAARVFASMNIPRAIEVRNLNTGAVKNIGVSHYATADIIAALSVDCCVWLAGPAGSGKTTACAKVAEALNLPFYPLSVGGQTTKSDLLGFIDATGTYCKALPVVRQAFEHGGLLLIDEIDAANPNVLTILNALLANGHCSFPDKRVDRHPDFRCIAAANTFGRGADRQYVGRNPIDAATIDRFAFVEFNYDEQLELAIAPNKEWCRYVQCVRHAVDSLKERIIVSPRATINGGKLLAAGVDREKVLNMVIFKGCGKDIRQKIINAADMEYNNASTVAAD